MSRHRNVRSMDYKEEYEGYDDVFGHSVDDEGCISPTDAQQWIYDRARGQQSIATFMASNRDIQEEDEGREDDEEHEKERRDSESYQLPELPDDDMVRLMSVMDEIRSIVGDSVTEKRLVETIMRFNYDMAQSLDSILNPPTTNACATATKITEKESSPAIEKVQCRSGAVIQGDIVNNNPRLLWSKDNIISNLYWNPEHPPPSTDTLRNDLLSALQASEMIHVRVDNSRNATFQFLSAAFTVETTNEEEISPLQEDKKHFGTLFVTESSDLQSASDILAESFSDNTSPWRIRNLLVQENIEENFMELLQSKLQKYHPIFVNSQDFQDSFRSALSTASKMHLKICNNPDDAEEVKPTIVLGQNRSYFDQPGSDIAPIVVMNIFRTVKEGIGMVNASNGGSVSIWCEKLSIAYEIASSVKVPSVWINCLAKFTPEIPFSFVFGGLTYGSEIAVLEKMLFQKRYGRNNAISPDDLKTFCNYPSTSLIIGGKYHFECLMSALQNAHLEESNLIKLGSDDIKNRFREILSSCTRVKCQNLASVYTQRKTIVFPFGETFAN
uniref:HBS1-like protein N-terminal domain-containing protein n=1 Tax=Phlebotomus papatasi TaxID=29031 RepID=A0A1B0D477_PHLPP